MSDDPSLLDRTRPTRVWASLREINDVLLVDAGAECITGEPGNPAAPCIRSVIQLDGDILTEVNFSGRSEEDAALARAHAEEVSAWFVRLQRTIRDASRTVFGVATVVPASVGAAVVGSFEPLLAMAGPVVAVQLRHLGPALRAAAFAGLLLLSWAAVRFSVAPDLDWMVRFWAWSLALVVVVWVVGYCIRWVIRLMLRRRR